MIVRIYMGDGEIEVRKVVPEGRPPFASITFQYAVGYETLFEWDVYIDFPKIIRNILMGLEDIYERWEDVNMGRGTWKAYEFGEFMPMKIRGAVRIHDLQMRKIILDSGSPTIHIITPTDVLSIRFYTHEQLQAVIKAFRTALEWLEDGKMEEKSMRIEVNSGSKEVKEEVGGGE